jgi:DNA-binding transcriptional ArsR family regulator
MGDVGGLLAHLPEYLRDHADTQVYAGVVHDQIDGFEMPADRDVEVAAAAFRMLSDPNRIKILWALLQGESSVNCLAELVDASPSAVSQHLAKLRLAGLVNVRREGTFAYYTAANNHVQRLLDEAIGHADHATERVPRDATHSHRSTATPLSSGHPRVTP